MVRLSKNVGNGMTVSVEGETFIEAFEQMAWIEECFEPCPIESSDGNFRLRVRDVEKDGQEFRYYELIDLATKARLSLSEYIQKDKKGFLYPKRKESANKGGQWLNNRGWEIWNPSQERQGQSSEPAAQTATGKAEKGNKRQTSRPF